MGDYNYFKLRATKDLLSQVETLMSRIEAGKQIESGSGGGKSATYKLDELEDLETRLDNIITELRCRAARGDEDVPEIYLEVEPEQTTFQTNFSGH